MAKYAELQFAPTLLGGPLESAAAAVAQSCRGHYPPRSADAPAKDVGLCVWQRQVKKPKANFPAPEETCIAVAGW